MSAPLLLIDAGNTRIKWATAEGAGAISPEGELHTIDATPERMDSLAKGFPEHLTVLSSVVPKLVPYFQNAFQDRLHLVTTASPALGVQFDYPNPHEVGADRLAAVVAVREEGLSPAIIIQCGTATAFNVIDANRRFCGGVIAPGPQAQLASLIGATAQLPLIALHPTVDVVGKTTEQAIAIGVTINFRGGVNAILRRLCDQTGRPPLTSIILTGGNAHFLTDHMEFPFTLRPLLVFEGLRIIGVRAFKETL